MVLKSGRGSNGGRGTRRAGALRRLRWLPLVLALGVGGEAGALTGGEVAQYLRARAAMTAGTWAAAAEALTPLTVEAESSLPVHDLVIYTRLLAGDYNGALAHAQSLGDRAVRSWPHTLVLFADRVQKKEWAEALALIEGQAPGLWVDMLAAWVEFGAGNPEAGIARLVERRSQPAEAFAPRSRNHYLDYHRGLLLLAADRVSEGVEALAAVSELPGAGHRAVLARSARLAVAEAEALFRRRLPDHPEHDIYEALLRETVTSRTVLTPAEGVAEALLGIAEMSTWSSGGGHARVVLEIAGILRPGDAEIARALAEGLASVGQHDDALGALAGAEPADRTLRLTEAEARQLAGDLDGAVRIYDDLLKADQDDPWLSFALAELYRRHEQYAPALEWYSTALEHTQQVIGDLREYGLEVHTVDQDLDFWALAGEALVPVATGAPTIPGELLAEQEDHFYFSLADYLRMEGQLWRVYFGRAVANERLGDWDPAEADLKRALRLSDGHPSVANYLGYYWVDQGVHLEEGTELLEEALRQAPENAYILDSVGWARYRAGEYEEALDYLERALRIEPGVAEVYDHFGDVLWQLGRPVEAEYQWLRALTLEPEEHIRERAEFKLREGLDGWLREGPGGP